MQKLTEERVSPATQPEAAPKKSLASRIFKRIALGMLLLLALAFAYIFLLLGEPDEESKYAATPIEDSILMPMTALDMPGESNVENLADSFGQPVRAVSQLLPMYKARIYDTAFEGEYARCVTITYTLEDGQTLLAESLRPTSAVTLLKKDGYTLDGSSLYTMGGLNAARMDNDQYACVFTQSDTAVYAILCPRSHADDLNDILRATTMAAPEGGQ